MRKSNVALRLQPSLLEEAKKAAAEEGVAHSAIRTESYFRERSAWADSAKTETVLAHAGRGRPPELGDEQ